jgi:DNA modification methylase
MLTGDCLELLPTLPERSVHSCVTSPPYFNLRNYNVAGQIGLEATVEQYLAKIVSVFREVHRVLRDDGTAWIVLGDTYAGGGRGGGTNGDKQTTNAGSKLGPLPPQTVGRKQLLGVPWRIALALQADGWILRSAIVWHKPNPMPESVRDRPTSSYEHVFLFAKNETYFYDQEAIRNPPTGRTDPITSFGATPDRRDQGRSFEKNGIVGANARNVWRPTSYHAKIVASDLAPEQKEAAHAALERTLDAVEAGVLADFRMHIRGVGAPLNGTDEGIGGRQRRLAKHGFYIMPIYGRGLTTNVWDISTNPFKGAHFATCPPDLAERCIMAGTSEYGCCARCGAPNKRVIKRVEPSVRDFFPTDGKVTGWQATCSCEAGAPVPCIVIDPFGGAGTTAAVATQLGRNSISIELNPDYVAIAEQRLANEATAEQDARADSR